MRKYIKVLVIVAVLLVLTIMPISYQTTVFATKEGQMVYLGGSPLGVIAYADGLVVTDFVEIITNDGVVCPAKLAGLMEGDIIKQINNKKIKDIHDIKTAIEQEFKGENQSLKIQVQRKNKLVELHIIPKKDKALNEYKLGLLAKNDIAGVGTLTYIKINNSRFGGLGHRIYDAKFANQDVYNNGKIFDCSIIGVTKGKGGKVGELRGHFNKVKSVGKIDKNNEFGIYGYINGDNDKLPLIKLGSRNEVKMGKAYIYTTIEGCKPQKYQVEIIKNMRQDFAGTRGLVIRVTDKKLLEKTGGIVQGMSGSPIVQNNKLIGAVTHVFINDSTKGYGVYIDWMIDN